MHLAWWFPAYLPVLLLVFKWVVLFTQDRYTLANTIVDLPFASFTFDLWAMVTKFNGQPLRPGRVTTPAGNRQENALIIVATLVQLAVYLLGVWAWLVSGNSLAQWASTALAVVLGVLVPLLLLGPPDESRSSVGG